MFETRGPQILGHSVDTIRITVCNLY